MPTFRISYIAHHGFTHNRLNHYLVAANIKTARQKFNRYMAKNPYKWIIDYDIKSIKLAHKKK